MSETNSDHDEKLSIDGSDSELNVTFDSAYDDETEPQNPQDSSLL